MTLFLQRRKMIKSYEEYYTSFLPLVICRHRYMECHCDLDLSWLKSLFRCLACFLVCKWTLGMPLLWLADHPVSQALCDAAWWSRDQNRSSSSCLPQESSLLDSRVLHVKKIGKLYSFIHPFMWSFEDLFGSVRLCEDWCELMLVRYNLFSYNSVVS